MNNFTNNILQGNAIDVLKHIPDKSIQMCMTSPPYWKLRDYRNEEQLGLEEDFTTYINKLCDIFDEVHRVLKDDGTCWVNIGDTYSSDNKIGVSRKSLIGIPDRFKIEMINRGWICRNEIIWHKPNAMPSSAKDRFNEDYEKLYMFSKKVKYKFNTQYEEAVTSSTQSKKQRKIIKTDTKYENVDEKIFRQGMHKGRGENLIEKRELPEQQDFVNVLRENFKIKDLYEELKEHGVKKSTIEHWFRRDEAGFSYPKKEHWDLVKTDLFPELTNVWYETDDINKNLHRGRLKRAVWSINTTAFKDAHFATYPDELVETPILAGTDKGDIVLDPFIGSGTTAKVSKKLGRKYVGIELNPDYIEIALNNIK